MIDEMSAAEFRAIRAMLGVGPEWLAERLDLSQKDRIRKWETGSSRIPVGVAAEVRQLARMTDDYVAQACEALGLQDDPVFLIPRIEVERVGRFAAMPLDWWRIVAGRIATQCGARIEWVDSQSRF